MRRRASAKNEGLIPRLIMDCLRPSASQRPNAFDVCDRVTKAINELYRTRDHRIVPWMRHHRGQLLRGRPGTSSREEIEQHRGSHPLNSEDHRRGQGVEMTIDERLEASVGKSHIGRSTATSFTFPTTIPVRRLAHKSSPK